jgi:hypothetical protein
MIPDDYTYSSFQKFLDYLIDSSDYNPATARNLKSSSLRVLSKTLTDKEKEDIREVAIEDVLERFIEKSQPDIPTESTIKNYKSRILRAISEFRKYASNPKNYSALALNTLYSKTSEDKNTQQREIPPMQTSSGSGIDEVKTFSVQVPIRSDLIVTIDNLPRELTKEEAERISNIIKAFAVQTGKNDLV